MAGVMFRQMTHPDVLNIACKWMPAALLSRGAPFPSDTLITNEMILQLHRIEERGAGVNPDA